MPRNRKKPGQTFASTGEQPISISAEAALQRAIAESTEKTEKIRVLEEENATLQIQIQELKKKIEDELA